MKKYLSILLISLASNTFAQSAHEAEAERLLEISGNKAAIENTVEVVLRLQLEKNPTLNQYKDVLRKFLKKHLSYEQVKGDYIALYTKAFTIEELVAMNEFYSSDLGKKAVRLTPAIIQKGRDMGATRVEENIPEFRQMVKRESQKRLRAQQK